MTLSDNARLFALLNVAITDAVISCWDAKYFFEFWRPITAIRLADTDGNPDTIPQTNWTPLLTTPNYADYDSGQQSNSGTAASVLTAYFGSEMPVEGFSDGSLAVTRSFANFRAAADEAIMARIWAGIHFRTAMDGRADAGAQNRRLRARACGATSERERQVIDRSTAIGGGRGPVLEPALFISASKLHVTPAWPMFVILTTLEKI